MSDVPPHIPTRCLFCAVATLQNMTQTPDAPAAVLGAMTAIYELSARTVSDVMAFVCSYHLGVYKGFARRTSAAEQAQRS